MMTVIALSWSLANCCPLVKSYRDQGYSDAQIEQIAREHAVPERIITIAKRICDRR